MTLLDALRSRQEASSHPIGNGQAGALGGGGQQRVVVRREPDGPMDGLGVVALGPAGSRVHGPNYSDKKKCLTIGIYATRISHMETELPTLCRFTYTWHAGEPEQRDYLRTSKDHVTTSERFESGITLTACERCGSIAGDY